MLELKAMTVKFYVIHTLAHSYLNGLATTVDLVIFAIKIFSFL